MVQILLENLGITEGDAQNAAGCLESAGFSRVRRPFLWTDIGDVSFTSAPGNIYTVVFDPNHVGGTPYMLVINGITHSGHPNRTAAKIYAQNADRSRRA